MAFLEHKYKSTMKEKKSKHFQQMNCNQSEKAAIEQIKIMTIYFVTR